jgi:hypothetical protein
MVFLPGRIRTYLSSDAWEARVDDLYQEERRGREVSCQEYRAEMAVGSLRSHLETQHNVYTSFALRATDTAPPEAPRHLTAVKREGKYRCPVLGCP